MTVSEKSVTQNTSEPNTTVAFTTQKKCKHAMITETEKLCQKYSHSSTNECSTNGAVS